MYRCQVDPRLKIPVDHFHSGSNTLLRAIFWRSSNLRTSAVGLSVYYAIRIPLTTLKKGCENGEHTGLDVPKSVISAPTPGKEN